MMRMTDLAVGGFIVDGEGQMRLRTPEHPPLLSFAWRDCSITAKVETERLLLSATLGRVPSSAVDPKRRESVFSGLRILPRKVPENWRLRLLPDHRLVMEAEEELSAPMTISALIAPVTRFLLELAPYMDALAELGVGGGPRGH